MATLHLVPITGCRLLDSLRHGEKWHTEDRLEIVYAKTATRAALWQDHGGRKAVANPLLLGTFRHDLGGAGVPIFVQAGLKLQAVKVPYRPGVGYTGVIGGTEVEDL